MGHYYSLSSANEDVHLFQCLCLQLNRGFTLCCSPQTKHWRCEWD